MIETYETDLILKKSNAKMVENQTGEREARPNLIKEDSDEHLQRVQIELDRLNYSNESINNLELELEEAKREYLRLMQEAENELSIMEKKLGNSVEKSKPYYEARIELHEVKIKYLKSKNRFETAQELYVAAKNMQNYAEENLENFNSLLESNSFSSCSELCTQDKETILKILEIARIKVNDTELSKQSSDLEQIEAFRKYDEKRQHVEHLEKDLKKSIEKSRKYFQLKAHFYKELRFQFTKIEGLKSCLKEAKQTYQQSLRNLETISTEIHSQRQSRNSMTENTDKNKIQQSSSISPLPLQNDNKEKPAPTENENREAEKEEEEEKEEGEGGNGQEEEDIDTYFNNGKEKRLQNEIQLVKPATTNPKINAQIKIIQISDEEIESLKLDDKLKEYKQNLCGSRQTEVQSKSNSPTLSSEMSTLVENTKIDDNAGGGFGSQFRMSKLWSSFNKKSSKSEVKEAEN